VVPFIGRNVVHVENVFALFSDLVSEDPIHVIRSIQVVLDSEKIEVTLKLIEVRGSHVTCTRVEPLGQVVIEASQVGYEPLAWLPGAPGRIREYQNLGCLLLRDRLQKSRGVVALRLRKQFGSANEPSHVVKYELPSAREFREEPRIAQLPEVSNRFGAHGVNPYRARRTPKSPPAAQQAEDTGSESGIRRACGSRRFGVTDAGEQIPPPAGRRKGEP